MCGRFALTASPKDIASIFDVPEVSDLPPRYNIAPSQDIAVIRQTDHRRRLDLLRWGLVPRWAKDLSIGFKTFNARVETAHEKPSFKAAFKARRCLVPASGFYEWDKVGQGRQPYYIRRSDGQPMAFAGLWESWTDPQGGEVVESCTILTTAANRTLAPIHDRMPVIVEPHDGRLWLNPGLYRVEDLASLFRPLADDVLELVPVSTFVNKAGHEGEACVAPLT